MKYFKHLYISEPLEKKKAKILRKLDRKKLQKSVCLLTLPISKNNQLEIINSEILLQPSYPQEELFIVGIASDYDEVLEMVEGIVQEVLDSTGGLDIRNYILKKEQED